MRKFMQLLLIAFLQLAMLDLVAQQRTVAGTVLSPTNEPLVGVTVQVKGTSRTTVTDPSGKFTIAANAGQTLQFSYVGFATQEKLLGEEASVSVRLQRQEGQLGEVVVTAYGISREKRSLGYGVPIVEGDELAATRRDNFITSLAGKVPGATITPSSGTPGASSQIVLRGATSIGGNNQPLIVVDGVPFDNQTLNQEALIGGGAVSLVNRNSDYGNRAMDINPNDIESVSILKGPEATALYGADGASGAIVITTKKGVAGKARVSYDNSFRTEEVYLFPKLQRKYGVGTNGIYDPNAVVNPFSIFGANGGVVSSFGPVLSPGTQTYDNVSSFFQPGFTQQHNINVGGGTELSQIRLSASYFDQKGVVPKTGYEKFTFRLTGSTKIFDKLNAVTSLTYTGSTTDKASKGAGGYLLNALSWPVTSDVKDYISPSAARKQLRNVANSLEFDNPFWDVNKNPSQDKLNRFTGNLNLSYDAAKWLNLGTIVGIDYFGQTGVLVVHPQSRYGFASNGFFSGYGQIVKNTTGLFKATVKKNFGSFNNSFTTGFAFENNTSRIEAQKGERFYEPEFISINNTDPLSRDAKTSISNVRKTRFFGNLVSGYKNFAYLSLAGSYEGVSTFMSKVVDKDPFFPYGSASLSVVFSELTPLKSLTWLNFFKGRVSLASTGKGPYAPYVIDYRFAPQITTGGGYAYDVTGNNFSLEPERSENIEYGTEIRLLNQRLNLDITRYQLTSRGQLIAARASYGTGFIIKWFNGGEVKNRGWEVQMNVIPVKSKAVQWSTTFNFARNVGEVVAMPADLPTYYDSDTWVFGNLRSQYFAGARIGNMAANTFRRNKNGQILISSSTGLPLRDDEFRTVGNREPDFTLGFVNSINYKNISLAFTLDFRKGGDVFNGTEYYLYLAGMSTRNLNREQPVIFQGVLLDGLENSATPTKNSIVISPLTNSTFYNNSAASEEDFIETVNWMRLRDITLNYEISPRMLRNQSLVRSASIFVTGTDLFMLTNYSGADPAVNANNASNRGFGGAGIDFGSLSTPRGINIGCRLNF
jgi:TonB-linked SusC/RagA family outer membrane protein